MGSGVSVLRQAACLVESRRGKNMSALNEPLDVCQAGEVASFHWDIRRDRVYWNGPARKVLGLADGMDISCSRELMLLVDPSHIDFRHEAIFGGDPQRQDYAVSYRLFPHGRDHDENIMVLERGRWLPDAHGRPAHVFGTIQRMDCAMDGSCGVVGLPEQMDPSSGLYCRSYFFRRLQQFLTEAQGGNEHAALLIVSLRNFSIVFDAYGYEAADAAYVQVAQRLSRVLRAGDIIARYGDNRMAMLIHDCREDDLGPALHRFLHAPAADPVTTDHGPVWPVLAIGAVLLPQNGRTLTEAIACAEEALAEAEERPASAAVVYAPSDEQVSRRTMKARMANEIFDALRRRRFTLAYQPVVHAQDGEPAFHEALLRILDAENRPMPASHLVPVAEELGLVRLIDLDVLNMAIEALQARPEGRLSINISATTVMDAAGFLERLGEVEDLVRGRLIVEITESAVLNDAERVQVFIDQLHELGCEVALDDFGAGYTSFRNLRDFSFDIVKLDGAFCEDLSNNGRNQHFVRSLIDLARNTGMRLVAEWVENEEDARLLREWGVDALQGYLFGRPGYEDGWPLLRCEADRQEAETPVVRPREAPVQEASETAMPAPKKDLVAETPVEERQETERQETERKVAFAAHVADDARGVAAEETAPAGNVRKDGDTPIGQLMMALEQDLAQLREMLARLRRQREEALPMGRGMSPPDGAVAAERA